MGKPSPPTSPLKGCIADTWEWRLSATLQRDLYEAMDLEGEGRAPNPHNVPTEPKTRPQTF